jgi:hypothetical protein
LNRKKATPWLRLPFWLILVDFDLLLDLFFCFNCLQKLDKLPHIHPRYQCAPAIARPTLGEKGLFLSCKGEGIASGKQAFPSTGTTSCLDWNFVHSSSLKQKIPPMLVGWMRYRDLYTSTVLHFTENASKSRVPSG